INMVDAVRPVLKVHDISISFAHGSEITIKPEDVIIEATDNCDAELDYALSQEVFTCADFLTVSEHLVEVTATDDQGNVTVEQITVGLDGGLFLMDCPQNIVVQLEPGECS